ncbi:MAG: hypothetical protein ACRDJ2_08790 [Actinomycetota bacterium]
MRLKPYRLTVAIAAIITVLTSMSAVALAAWSVSSAAGNGGSGAGSMPPGSTPTASVANRNLTVTWPMVTVPGHGPASSYRVTRFNGTGVAQTITNNCTGQITGLTCTEIGLPPGQWRYAITPRYAGWDGANGPMSTAVTVNAPSVSLNPTTITQFPAQITATISNYLPNQSVSIRLDSAGGTQLGTLTSGAGGGGSTNVSIPNTVTDGSHSLFAVGVGGDTSNAPFTVNAPIPAPSSLLLANGGNTTGQPQRSDTVTVTFSSAINSSSMCSAWGPTGDQSLNSDAAQLFVAIENNAASSGNDRLVVSSAALTTPVCATPFAFGSIDLGSASFVTNGDSYFAGTGGNRTTATWTASTRTLVIRLGGLYQGNAPARVNQSITATYTPDPAIMGSNGRQVGGTISSTAVQF